MTSLRDIFINSLCNFTHLHSPATMKYKNALAFKYLLQVAGSVGDHLAERWVRSTLECAVYHAGTMDCAVGHAGSCWVMLWSPADCAVGHALG
ncbi:MAG: hypothetical protein ACT6T3_21960, partial [Agrobacterium sp.]|uniref:hypothetical protein n=1 Tax=Agrobacterium sp. TaxID=361 RepID=UPI0040335360